MKKHSILSLILLVSLLPFFSFFITTHLVHTHDGLVHLPRIAAFFKALTDGQFPVRWAGDLNYGYGMPLFIFIYHTPYLIASLFLLLGLGLVSAFKLSLLVSFLLSGFFMFLFARAFFNDEKKAILITLLYQFAPFHLVDILIRGSFGEVYTYAFLPAVLYGLTKFFSSKKIVFLLLTSLTTALLVISHNSISLLFFAVAVLFTFFFAPSRKSTVLAFAALFLGLLLSAYYWIPALLEHKYTYGDLLMKDLYKDHFPMLWKFLIPNIFDTRFLQTDNLSLQLGVFSTAAVVIGSAKLLFGKVKEVKAKKIVLFCLLLILGSFFFMSKLSLSLWEQMSFLRQFQFPWRFLSVTTFATAMLGTFLITYLKKTWTFYLVCIFVVLSSVAYWIPKEGIDTIDEQYYWNFPLNTTYYGETDVIWSAGPARQFPENRIEIIQGEGTPVTPIVRKSNQQSFTIDALSDITLVSHTQYFPGWRVYIDKKAAPIQFQNPNHRGLLVFSVPQGRRDVVITFGESKLRVLADSISLLSLGFFIVVFFYSRRKHT